MSEVRITGLTRIDVLDLEKESGVRFEEVPVPKGTHGELTVFAAYFAISALTALAAYLLKKNERQSFEETVEITHSDGRRELRKVKWTSSKSEAPEADIVSQIRGPGF